MHATLTAPFRSQANGGPLNSAFFDETDATYCGYNFATETNCTALRFTRDELAIMYKAKIDTLARAVAKLNAAKVYPVLSLDNHWLPSGHCQCALCYADYFESGLINMTYFRFYEFWMVEYIEGFLYSAVKESQSESTTPNAFAQRRGLPHHTSSALAENMRSITPLDAGACWASFLLTCAALRMTSSAFEGQRGLPVVIHAPLKPTGNGAAADAAAAGYQFGSWLLTMKSYSYFGWLVRQLYLPSPCCASVCHQHAV